MSVVSNGSRLISLARLGELERVISAVKPSLDALRDVAGFRLGDEVYAQILRDAGEAWLSRPGPCRRGCAGVRSPRLGATTRGVSALQYRQHMETERERTAIPASQAEEQPTRRLPRLSLPEVCPHLGLRDDPASCALFPRADHACAVPGAPPPPLEWQAGYCLSGRHAECPHFRAHAAGQAAEPDGRPPRWRLSRRASLAVAGALAAACGLLGVAFARGYISIDVDTVAPTPSTAAGVVAASPATRGGPGPVPAATATVVPSPTPAPVETLTATPQPVETPTPVPTPSPRPETHVVAEGETLSEIAARYGTTVEAIMELNGLTDPDNIPAGMVLRLP